MAILSIPVAVNRGIAEREGMPDLQQCGIERGAILGVDSADAASRRLLKPGRGLCFPVHRPLTNASRRRWVAKGYVAKIQGAVALSTTKEFAGQRQCPPCSTTIPATLYNH